LFSSQKKSSAAEFPPAQSRSWISVCGLRPCRVLRAPHCCVRSRMSSLIWNPTEPRAKTAKHRSRSGPAIRHRFSTEPTARPFSKVYRSLPQSTAGPPPTTTWPPTVQSTAQKKLPTTTLQQRLAQTAACFAGNHLEASVSRHHRQGLALGFANTLSGRLAPGGLGPCGKGLNESRWCDISSHAWGSQGNVLRQPCSQLAQQRIGSGRLAAGQQGVRRARLPHTSGPASFRAPFKGRIGHAKPTPLQQIKTLSPTPSYQPWPILSAIARMTHKTERSARLSLQLPPG